MVEAIHLQLLLATFAGWVTRQQAQTTSYLIEENRVLKEQLVAHGRPLRLTDDQRRRLAAEGKPLGRELHGRVATIVTPDTIMAWYQAFDRLEVDVSRVKAILRHSGTKIVRTSIQAPNMNAFAERFVRSTKSERLDRMIFVGGDSLDRAVREFTIHDHAERPHQGIENALIAGGPTVNECRVEVRDRLGGLLKYYHRQAA